MALFRDIEGRFYEFPKDILERCEVKKELMDAEFRNKPVVGVQVPRPQAQAACADAPGQFPGLVVNQYFGAVPNDVKGGVGVLPSDIELAHYGTTIDNPRE